MSPWGRSKHAHVNSVASRKTGEATHIKIEMGTGDVIEFVGENFSLVEV